MQTQHAMPPGGLSSSLSLMHICSQQSHSILALFPLKRTASAEVNKHQEAHQASLASTVI